MDKLLIKRKKRSKLHKKRNTNYLKKYFKIWLRVATSIVQG